MTGIININTVNEIINSIIDLELGNEDINKKENICMNIESKIEDNINEDFEEELVDKEEISEDLYNLENDIKNIEDDIIEISENIINDKNENGIDSIDDLNSEDNNLINKEINSDAELLNIKDNKIEFYNYGFDFDKTSDFLKEILDFNNEIE